MIAMNFNQLEATIRQAASSVEGKAGIAVDTAEGQIHIHADEPFPSASLIKIPILLEAYRQAQEGRLDLHQPYAVPSGEHVGGTGVIHQLSDALRLSLQDLMALMIIVSDNTATNMIIDLIGMGTVNKLSDGLGCGATVLGRKMLDFQAKRNGKDNFTSARDMIIFLKEIVDGSTLKQEAKDAALRLLRNQQFNAKLPARIIGGFSLDKPVLAHKTGELPGTEHDAGILQVNGKTAYIAVLTTDLVDNLPAQQVISTIGKAVFDYLNE